MLLGFSTSVCRNSPSHNSICLDSTPQPDPHYNLRPPSKYPTSSIMVSGYEHPGVGDVLARLTGPYTVPTDLGKNLADLVVCRIGCVAEGLGCRIVPEAKKEGNLRPCESTAFPWVIQMYGPVV